MTPELKLLNDWRKHPALFVRQCIGAEPEEYQEEVLEYIGKLADVKLRKSKGEELEAGEEQLLKLIGVVVKSGRGAGKDAMLAWLFIWLLTCWPTIGEDAAKGMVTAPSAPQLSTVLWSELNKWINKSPVVREHLFWQSDKVYVKSNKAGSFVIARTANVKGTAEEHAETLAGLHSPYMIVAGDEASAIPRGVFSPLTGTLTGAVNLAVLIGNPTRGSGYFFECFNKNKDFWKCFTWNTEESPRVNRDSVELKFRKWGRDSNVYRIEVLGEFPITDSHTLIAYEWAMAAIESEIEIIEDDPVLIGLDIGGGGDKTIIVTRKGNVVMPFEEFDSADTMLVTGWIMSRLAEEEYDMAFIDPIGIGAGVYHRLKELGVKNLYPVDVRATSTNPACFKLRDDILWRLREQFEQKTIKIPDDEEFIGELTTIKWGAIESKGTIKIESKKDMRTRGLHSPNKLDALAMTYYFGDNTLRSIGKDAAYRQKKDKVLNWKVI